MKSHLVVILCVVTISCSALPTDLPEGNVMLNELLDAIKDGNVHRVQELANDKVINMTLEGGKQSIHIAAESGNVEIVEALIKKGADVNIGDAELLTPLHLAVLNEDEAVTDLLIKNGAKINEARDIDGNTPLFLAALNSNEKIIETLLSNNANVSMLNNVEESALFWAVLNKNEKIIDLLVKKGVDVNLGNRMKNTALHNAIYNSNVKVVESLVKSGAKVNAMNARLQNPLYWSVYNGNQKCKEELLKDIADEKHFSRRMYYETKLEHFTHPIQQNAGEKYIELFLKNGAEINNQDSNGKTAYDEADFYGNERMKEFLAKHGGESAKKETGTNFFDSVPSLITVAFQIASVVFSLDYQI